MQAFWVEASDKHEPQATQLQFMKRCRRFSDVRTKHTRTVALCEIMSSCPFVVAPLPKFVHGSLTFTSSNCTKRTCPLWPETGG